MHKLVKGRVYKPWAQDYCRTALPVILLYSFKYLSGNVANTRNLQPSSGCSVWWLILPFQGFFPGQETTPMKTMILTKSFHLPQVLSSEETIFVRDFVLKYSWLTLPWPEIFVFYSKDRSWMLQGHRWAASKLKKLKIFKHCLYYIDKTSWSRGVNMSQLKYINHRSEVSYTFACSMKSRCKWLHIELLLLCCHL